MITAANIFLQPFNKKTMNMNFFAFRRPVSIALAIFCWIGSAQGSQKNLDDTSKFDPWVLRKDLHIFSELEKAQGSDSKKQAARHALNQKWLPALAAARQKGDLMAQMVLINCDAAKALDRSQIDSTCTGEFEDQKRAAAQIGDESLGLSIRLGHSRIGGDQNELYEWSQKNCSIEASKQCFLEEAIRRLELRLQALESDGVTSYIRLENIENCPMPAPEDRLNTLYFQCASVLHQILAVAALAPRSFKVSLEESLRPNLADDERWPYSILGTVLPQMDGKIAPNDVFHARLYRRVFRSLSVMDTNIQRRLDDDSRWSAFLQITKPGLSRETNTSKMTFAASKHYANRLRAKKSIYDENIKVKINEALLRPFIGIYAGTVTGTPSITAFFTQSGYFEGVYMIEARSESEKVDTFGTLGPCLSATASELLCVWHDDHGVGDVSLIFNKTALEFRGEWSSFGRGSRFTRMEKKWWNEPRLGWTGKLIR